MDGRVWVSGRRRGAPFYVLQKSIKQFCAAPVWIGRMSWSNPQHCRDINGKISVGEDCECHVKEGEIIFF